MVRLIAVGAFHNLALQEDGTLWAWGNNEYGQLGTGDTQPRSQPIPVQGLSGLTLVCVPYSNFFFNKKKLKDVFSMFSHENKWLPCSLIYHIFIQRLTLQLEDGIQLH